MGNNSRQSRNIDYQFLNAIEIADARSTFAFMSINVGFYAVKTLRFDVVEKLPRLASTFLGVVIRKELVLKSRFFIPVFPPVLSELSSGIIANDDDVTVARVAKTAAHKGALVDAVTRYRVFEVFRPVGN